MRKPLTDRDVDALHGDAIAEDITRRLQTEAPVRVESTIRGYTLRAGAAGWKIADADATPTEIEAEALAMIDAQHDTVAVYAAIG